MLRNLLISFALFCLCAQAFGQSKAHLADSLYKAGEYAQAQEEYDKLVLYWQEKAERDSSLHAALKAAKCDIQLKNSEKGRASLHALLEEAALPATVWAEALLEIGHSWLDEFNIGEASNWVQKSLDLQRKIRHPDTVLWAKALDMRAILHLFSDEGEKAVATITKAHNLRQRVLAADDVELGYSANTLYMIQSSQGNLAAADTAIRQAWEILGTQLPEEHPHRAVLANNLSTLLADQGDPQGAIKYLMEARSANEEGQRMEALVENYVNLCYVYDKLERWEDALTYASKAKQIADDVFPNPHETRAGVLDALGAVYMSIGHFQWADTFFYQSLQQRKALSKTPTAAIAQSLFNRGLIAAEQGSLAQAREWFEQASSIREDLLGRNSPKWADAIGELAALSAREGKWEEAIPHWEDAEKAYLGTLGPAHPHTQENYLRLAEGWGKLENPSKEADYLNLAWKGLHSDSLLSGIGLDIYPVSVYSWANAQLDVWLRPEKTFTRSEWERHLAHMQEVLDWIPLGNSVHIQNGVSSKPDQALIDFFHKLALLSHKANVEQAPDLQAWQNLLLSCLQGVRGSQIRAALRRRQVLKAVVIPDSVLEREQELEIQLRFLRRNDESKPAMRTQFFLEWASLQQHFRETYPSYYEARFADTPPQIETLQDQLGFTSLVAYLDLDSAFLGVHIDKDDVQTFLIPFGISQRQELQQYIQQLRKPAPNASELHRIGSKLYQSLWAPIAKAVAEEVQVLPDGPLYGLNFDLLPLSEKGDSLLIHTHIFSYAHSLQLSPEASFPDVNRVLGIAPGFTQELKDFYRGETDSGHPSDTLFFLWSRTPWSLDWVNSLAEKGWGKALTERQATEQAFWQWAPEASILHFGTHADLMDTDPLMNFLVLTPEPQKLEHGYLRTYELYEKSLQADLAVLTACETGAGEYLPGEGVISLAHAFRYAGCPTVMYSLWPIDDEQTQVLVEGFYQSLRKGNSPARALRQAKLDYLENASQDSQSPFFWGGLVLTGANPAPTVGIGTILLWIPLCILLGIGGYFLAFYRKKRQGNDDLSEGESIED